MCYSLRDLERERRRAAQETLTTSDTEPRLSRPRLAGAIAAAVVAVAVAAALIFPSSTTAVSRVQSPPAAPAVIEQTSSAMDDGVHPVAEAKTGAGACDHGL